MNDYSKIIARKLLQINAIKLSPQNPFTWASGMQSPIYCDNRLTLSYPDIRDLILLSFQEVLKTYPDVESIGGVATAGIPHGMLLADKMHLPFFYVRDKAKSHGRQNQIEGKLESGTKTILVEDLISTGMSCLRAVDGVREADSEVLVVLSIFNYGFQKAVNAFESKKCTFASLCDYDTLIKEAVNMEYVSAKEIEGLTKWRTDPENWSPTN